MANRFSRAHNILSQTAADNNINNYPGADRNVNPLLTEETIWNNLRLVHENCINPILDAFGAENIKITSAYRCMALNKIMGGTPNSQHINGYAIDLVSIKHPSSLLWNFCFQNITSYNQLIWEFPERGDYTSPSRPFSWIHISYIEKNNPKTSTLSTKQESLQTLYQKETTCKIGNYTHNIVYADNNLF